VAYYGLSIVPMYHLNDFTGCYVHSLGTIPIIGGAVRPNHPVAVQHILLVLSIQVPATMLSIVELAMPRMNYYLHLVFPSVPRL
jgi:hypothetical protein